MMNDWEDAKDIFVSTFEDKKYKWNCQKNKTKQNKILTKSFLTMLVELQ